MKNDPSPKNIIYWFDPRNRKVGSWAFILNRITALGLTLYLLMHLIALGQLTQGAQAFDGFIAMVDNPILKFGELLVIAAGLIHGLNGIRVALNSFGVGVRYQRHIFYVLMAVALGCTLFFGYHMYFG